MRAAWYEKQGPANEVLIVGQMPDPRPEAGEVRIRIAASGINPGDIKKRQDSFGSGMPYPSVIPHSDGAGKVDLVGDGVSAEWIGRCGKCGGTARSPIDRSGRPQSLLLCRSIMSRHFPRMCRRRKALASEYPASPLTVPSTWGGDVRGRTVLVQGAGGAVVCVRSHFHDMVVCALWAQCALRSEEPAARTAGAHEVILNNQGLVERVKALAPEGVDHVVEVAFGANIDADIEMLKMGGSIGAYATDNATPKIPFWLMVFKNIRVFFLGSDDFPVEAKVAATRDLSKKARMPCS